MTDPEILKKAIEKAEVNGFAGGDVHMDKDEEGVIEHCIETGLYASIIFSHDFAKAFWGELILCKTCRTEIHSPVSGSNEYIGDCDHFKIENRGSNGDGSIRGWGNLIIEWEYYLQQMVLEEEPLKYLRKYL